MKKLFILAAVTVSFVGFAQGKKGGEGNVTSRQTTEYVFDGDTIEGDGTKPDVEYIDALKKVEHSSLIKIREHFKDKVMQSVGEL